MNSYNGKPITYNNRNKNDKIIFSKNGTLIIRNEEEFKIYHKNNRRDTDYDKFDYVIVFGYPLLSKVYNKFINIESKDDEIISFIKENLSHIL